MSEAGISSKNWPIAPGETSLRDQSITSQHELLYTSRSPEAFDAMPRIADQSAEELYHFWSKPFRSKALTPSKIEK